MSEQGMKIQRRLLGNKPAALNEGIIVAAKANQKPPVMQINMGRMNRKSWESLPMVPNTTQGNVFPSANSRRLVITSKSPPRKIVGPLSESSGQYNNNFGSHSDHSLTCMQSHFHWLLSSPLNNTKGES